MVIFVYLLPFLIIFCGMIVDMGRFLDARAKVQTIADASALAGASTAEIIEFYEYDIAEENGEEVLEEEVVERQAHIDPATAKQEARRAAEVNGGNNAYWKEQAGHLEEWDGEKIGIDNYRTWIRVKLSPGMFYPVWRMMGREGGVPVYIDGKARAWAGGE